MEDNGKCIILKRKEYDELVSKANKPPKVEIRNEQLDLKYSFTIREYNSWGTHYEYEQFNVKGTIDISDKLLTQISNISSTITSEFNKQLSVGKEHVYKELANMSRRDRNKLLKQYRDKR